MDASAAISLDPDQSDVSPCHPAEDVPWRHYAPLRVTNFGWGSLNPGTALEVHFCPPKE